MNEKMKRFEVRLDANNTKTVFANYANINDGVLMFYVIVPGTQQYTHDTIVVAAFNFSNIFGYQQLDYEPEEED